MASKGKVYDYMQRPTYRPATSEQFTKILRDVPLSRIEAELEYLVSQRLIKKINGEKYVLNAAGEPDPYDASVSYEGVISVIRSGAGFVKLEDGKEFFVEKNNVCGALHNDKVKVSPVINKRSDRDLEEARVTAVISRAKDFFVAQVITNPDGGLNIACDDLRMNLPIILDSYKNLVPGSKILVKIGSYEGDRCYGTVSRVLGHVNDPGVDILSIVIDNGLKYEFDQQTEDYVNNLEFKITPEDRKIRKNLSHLPIITIDPWDAKDLDDAIYVKQNNDGTFFLSVSIADVSWFVRYGTPLDDEAVLRGTSVYLTDRVIPMLPHKLSNDICSLNQLVERFTLTCDITIDQNGKYLSYDVYPSIIRSWRRFAYDEVNKYFANEDDINNEKPEVVQTLLAGRKLHKILRNAKEKSGYVDFDIKEAKVVTDKNGVAIDVVARERGEAQMMIESFMIAANEAVVLKMNDLNLPMIYRVHEKPDGQRVRQTAELANKMGFKVSGDFDNLTPLQVATWLENQRMNPNYGLVAKLLLRSMAKAKYSTHNIGHFGLASEDYTHFTSPIRRYPDLIVHRLYWVELFMPQILSKGLAERFKSELPQLCEQASAKEITAVTTEREVNNMKFAEYMSQHLGEQFEGVVSTVVSFGAYIELANTVEGLLALRNLRDDFYVYDEKSMSLTGRNTRRVLTLGTKVLITVLSASKSERKIDFALVKVLA